MVAIRFSQGLAMRYRPLDSTWLDSAAYDPLTRTLTLRLKNHRAYQFFGVPNKIYRGLLAAESPGRFYNSWINDRGFRSRRIC